MELQENITLETLDQIQIGTEESIDVCFGLLCTLYFKNSHTKENRLKIAQCADEYLALFQENLKWCLPPRHGRYKKITKKSTPSVVELLEKKHDSDQGFCFVATGGEQIEDASPYSLNVLTNPEYEKEETAYFSATFPFSWIGTAESGSFQKLVHQWCERISPFHGYAGLAAIQSADDDQRRRTEPSVYPFAMRFPGLEIEDAVTLSIHLHKGIKGVNWLTVLSDEWLGKVGGKEHLKKELGEEFPFHDYSGGTIIQAGPQPQIGDRNRNQIPLHYKKVNQLVKTIRIDFPEEYLEAPEGIDGLEKTKEWFARFD